MDALLSSKLKSVFGGRVVQKSLARDAGFSRLPQFVVEYLVANHVHTSTQAADLQQLRESVAKNLPEADRRGLVKAQLLREGTAMVIDKLNVEVNLRTGQLVGSLTYTGESNVEVPEQMVNENPRLLTGGLWAGMRLMYHRSKGKKANVVSVDGLRPLQSNEPSLDDFSDRVSQFTMAEWIDVLLTSVGYEPRCYTEREKILLLVRLLPVVEDNYNMIELGPRQTGKTYLLRNVSPSAYVASGANLSSAALFVNASSGGLGIIPSYKVVVLDEVAHTRFDDISTISNLKDYMESANFTRAGKQYSADASLVMAGNLDVLNGQPDPRYQHLFEALPEAMQDTALLDRVHAYLPGWEVPKVTPESISQGSGLVVDYLGQVLGQLRKRSRRDLLHSAGQVKNATRRDVVAMEKTVSGLGKLLFPHDRVDQQGLNWMAHWASELRGRVTTQLNRMAPGEFSDKQLEIAPTQNVARAAT